jgi:hypothetical protein
MAAVEPERILEIVETFARCLIARVDKPAIGLKQDGRPALDSSIDESLAHYLAEYDKVYTKWYKTLDEMKIQQITYSNEELAAFKAKAGKPLWDAWVADMTAKGIPAQELLDTVQSKLN